MIIRDVLTLKGRAELRSEFINLYFGRNTPGFVRELLAQWDSELESETEVLWNDRRVAEVALPIMLKTAADMGIDVETNGSRFCRQVASEWNGTINCGRDDEDDVSSTLSEHRSLEAALLHDAEAINTLLNSAYVPAEVKNKLGDAFLELPDNFFIYRKNWLRLK